eukprot:scaffold68795_cov64-Attheya_sp.AAC.2
MVPPSKARRCSRRVVRQSTATRQANKKQTKSICPSYAKTKSVMTNQNCLLQCVPIQSLRFSNSGLDINKTKETDAVVNHDDDQDDNMSLLDDAAFPFDDEQQSSEDDEEEEDDDEEDKEDKEEMCDAQHNNTRNIHLRRLVDFCDQEIKDDEPIMSKVSSQQYKQSFQPFEHVLIRLYDLIETAGAPLTLLDDIIESRHHVD